MEYTGKIIRLLHLQDDGFIRFQYENGDKMDIYFRCPIRTFKNKRDIWQPGDKMRFDIIENTGTRPRAEIKEYLGNDYLVQLTKTKEQRTVAGTIELFDDRYFLREEDTGYRFAMSNIKPLFYKVRTGKPATGVMDWTRDKISVRLPEVDAFIESLYSQKQQQELIDTKIIGEDDSLYTISLDGTNYIGTIAKAELEENKYAVGDSLKVVFEGYSRWGLRFKSSHGKNSNVLYGWENDVPYHVTILSRAEKTLIAQIESTTYTARIKLSDSLIEDFCVGESITAYYKSSSRYGELVFLTEEQYLAESERESVINYLSENPLQTGRVIEVRDSGILASIDRCRELVMVRLLKCEHDYSAGDSIQIVYVESGRGNKFITFDEAQKHAYLELLKERNLSRGLTRVRVTNIDDGYIYVNPIDTKYQGAIKIYNRQHDCEIGSCIPAWYVGYDKTKGIKFNTVF